jgi:pyruvate formate lyase activating enzyme
MPIATSRTKPGESRRPLIVDIRRGSLEDGPGIRSVVFFKGCPLRCVFCHNPETQEIYPEIAFTEERCMHCGSCAKACPQAALDLSSPTRIDRDRCDLCGACEDACPTSALRIVGKYWPVDSLVELLLRDESFYRHSGGGVTLSGGECTLFPEYVAPLLQRLKALGVHIAIETSGWFDYEVFAEKILPFVDLIFFDLKLMDADESRRYLGQSNERILENLRRSLAEPRRASRLEVRPRVPLIPGITDTRINLSRIVNCLCHLGPSTMSVVPYNPLGLAAYRRLGKSTPDLPTSFANPDREAELIDTVRSLIAAADRPLAQFDRELTSKSVNHEARTSVPALVA